MVAADTAIAQRRRYLIGAVGMKRVREAPAVGILAKRRRIGPFHIAARESGASYQPTRYSPERPGRRDTAKTSQSSASVGIGGLCCSPSGGV